MKNKETDQNQLDERSIEAAATAATVDLQLDARVELVCADGDRWCVQFTAGYAQFCDTFRDRFGRANSFKVIREKVKRHLLKQQQNKIRSNVRIRRGKPQRQPPADTLVDAAAKTIEAVAGQAVNVTSELISQAARLPEKALKALDNAAEAVDRTAQPLRRQATPKSEQPLARVTIKAKAVKPARKRQSSTRQAAAKKGKTTKKAASKKRGAKAVSAVKSVKKRGRKIKG